MYLSYYNLDQNPFQISTDPRFLWLGEKHEEGLATLQYGVQENKGFLLLTGDVGTGKTTLVNALLRNLPKDTLVATIRDPKLEPLDFFNYLAHAFQMGNAFRHKGTFLIHFERLLHQAYEAGKKVVLIIDEAQRINQELLEEVRLLSNIERQDSKLLNIFFVGQTEFNEILLSHENRAIRQRITVNYNILPLTRKETEQYIRYRLQIAAADETADVTANAVPGQPPESVRQPDNLFAADSIRTIYTFTRGYPRLINILCDRCLLTGYVEDAKTITPDIVRECITELTIPRMNRLTGWESHPSPEPVSSPAPAPTPESSLPTVHPGSDESIRSAGNGKRSAYLSRLIIPAAAFVIILAAGYISRTPAVLTALQDLPIKQYTLHLRQLAFDWLGADGDLIGKKESIAVSPPFPSLPAESPVLDEQRSRSLEAVRQEVQQYEPEQSLADSPAGNIVPPGESPVPDMDILPTDNVFDWPDKVSAPIPQIEKEKNNIIKDIKMMPLVAIDKLVVPFPTDSNFPPPASLEKLNQLMDSLQLRPQATIRISGYTDSLGYESYNQRLAEFRANSIKSYLVGKGLSEAKIIARGYGSQNPLAPNDTESGRKANRRVEIEIIPQAKAFGE